MSNNAGSEFDMHAGVENRSRFTGITTSTIPPPTHNNEVVEIAWKDIVSLERNSKYSSPTSECGCSNQVNDFLAVWNDLAHVGSGEEVGTCSVLP
jgi:hypothetical protein